MAASATGRLYVYIMTPNSSTVPYLTVQDFLARKDMYSVAQWVTDNNGYEQPQIPSPLPQALYHNVNLLQAISAACGELEMACFRGQAYAAADLQALVAQGGVAAAAMKSLLADLVMMELIKRRAGPAPPETVVQAYNKAMDQLDALSRGERIFPFIETESAGVVTTRVVPPRQYFANNMITARWNRFWGVRQAERRFF